MNPFLKRIASQFPPAKRLLKYRTLWEPGHYYSAIPLQEEALEIAEKSRQKIFDIQGVDLREESQLRLFDELVPFMKESSFRNEEKVGSHRFFNRNTVYGYSDSLLLEGMIRRLRPGHIIEAGSGFTSALMLDVNDKYFGGKINLNFIEPYPERLFRLLTEQDKQMVGLHIQGLQTVDIALFRMLEENDILFIDSTHVAKTGSDLLYLFFEILPALKSGVYIHFHDIFNNFEYLPFHFNRGLGFAWNENYFLRAFLMHNNAYETVMFSNFLESKYRHRMEEKMPDYPFFTGAQFWMRKL